MSHIGDGALFGPLFGDAGTARLFDDAAAIRAMLRVESELAAAQAECRLIAPEAARLIGEACGRFEPDIPALGEATARNGVPVPGLVAALRASLSRDAASALHFGATSQDIVDTALVLRLREALDLWETRLADLLRALGCLAQDHARTAMAARTYGQAATPTTFGAVVASWGRPLLRHQAEMAGLRERVLVVSLGGASGTLAAMGPQGGAVRAELARRLGLGDPGAPWHAERDGIARLAGWMTSLCASLAKIGEDLVLLTQSGIGEVRLEGAGGSSTMPQKQNPVGASVLVALGRQAVALGGLVQGSSAHRQQRDGAAWFSEWLALPPLSIGTGRALSLARETVDAIVPDVSRMTAALDADGGVIHAEALSFALAREMGREAAEAVVRRLCAQALASGTDLRDLVRRDLPETDWRALLSGEAQWGDAAEQALAFAQSARQASPGALST